MKTKNFSYSFLTQQPPKAVFNLLLDVKQWWSGLYGEIIRGKSESLGDEFTFQAGNGAHQTKQKLIEWVPQKRMAWLVTESNLTFLKNPDEWADTKIRFDLAAEGEKTRVTFTHDGLIPGIECYGGCSDAWTAYLQKLEDKLNRK